MSRPENSVTVSTVVHVIPSAVARGAQREARALADHLDRPGRRAHRVLSLFAGPQEVAVDTALDHPGGTTPGVGLDPRLVVRLRSVLNAMDPVAVIAHGSEPLKYLAPAMVGSRRNLVYYAIGTYSGSSRRTQDRLWKFLLGRPDLIIAEGEEVRSECKARFGVPEHKIVYVPNGRDPTTFRPPDSVLRTTLPQLLFVGAFTAGKRPQQFITAVRCLRTRGVSFTARMAGTGPLHTELVEPAVAAGVELLGSRSDVPELLREADVLAFTSLSAGEGMPGVLVEAGLSGLPVVATDVPGVRSIVDHGVTGFVVDQHDLDGMVANLESLLDDPELRTSMGQAARRSCLSRFSIDSVAHQWATSLAPLIEGPRPARRWR